MSTPGTSRALLVLVLVALLAAPAFATDYYVAPLEGAGGAGTLSNPYKIGDLYSLPDPNGVNVLGPAITSLYPGDTLWFRGGTYNLTGWNNGNLYALSMIRPARSGSPGAPIAFRAYPGESVTLSATNAANVIANGLPATGGGADYIWIDGFTINGSIGYVGGAHLEISYCDVIGSYVPTGDNHDLIFVNQATDLWIHHNILRNQTGLNDHSSGLKLFNSHYGIIEDNYAHDNGTGMQDKEGCDHNTFRRNYLVNNPYHSWLGGNNNYYPTILRRIDFVYDNVVASLSPWYNGDGTELHDNLILSAWAVVADGGEEYNLSVWNNIALDDSAASIYGYINSADAYASNRFGTFDYNVYTAPPTYRFVDGWHDLAYMQARGYETHASVVNTGLDIYNDYTNWTLKTAWQTAGRYGDPVGPPNVAQIMDTSRYGPTARSADSAPVANFTAIPTSGAVPLTVNFTDTSLNSPTTPTAPNSAPLPIQGEKAPLPKNTAESGVGRVTPR